MHWLALDVGGSGIKHAVVNQAYELSDRGIVPTRYDSHAAFIDTVGGIYHGLGRPVDGVAISSCGELDPRTGQMFSGGTLRFNSGVNMIESVQARCGVPVTVENDANCALLAEARLGSLTDCRNAAALIIGTAVGGAIMIERAIYHGSHFHAGNASFTRTDVRDPASPQLNQVAGVGALLAGYARSSGTVGPVANGREFFERVNAGDRVADAALTDYCAVLGGYIVNLQALLDVDAVAIGGGISAQSVFVERLRTMAEAAFAQTTVQLPRPEIRACRHFNDANLLGAVLHHRAA